MLVSASVGNSHGRIGETPDECVERYGAVVETFEARIPGGDPGGQMHRKSGINIMIEFRDGKAWLIRFENTQLNHSQQDVLLKANAGGSRWKGPVTYLGRRQWILESGEMHALARPAQGRVILEVMTDACLQARDRLRKERLALVGTDEGRILRDKLLQTSGLEGF
ncbi:hypothetical protein BH23VER1_BH23VER1_16100 [soil metagenome]